MDAPKQIPGYVRCAVTHLNAEWSFEVMAEDPKVAISDIETEDGTISVGLNRENAERLLQTLELFLQDWPKGREPS